MNLASVLADSQDHASAGDVIITLAIVALSGFVVWLVLRNRL
jgi:hypothetical protein